MNTEKEINQTKKTNQPNEITTENNQSNEIKENNEMTEDDISFMCRFCNVKLIGGYDDNELVHCQDCHNIWDGNAQCDCWFNN